MIEQTPIPKDLARQTPRSRVTSLEAQNKALREALVLIQHAVAKQRANPALASLLSHDVADATARSELAYLHQVVFDATESVFEAMYEDNRG